MILVKFLKITKYLFLLIVLFVFFELTSCNNHYVNKTSVSLDINNINNPQVKKLMRAVDGYLGNIYFNFSKAKQKEFFDKRQDEYEKLPDEIYFKADHSNLTISNGKSTNNSTDWTRSHGNHLSNKFSSLKKINTQNISTLGKAWEYKFKDKGPVSGNPIYYDGKLYLGSPDKSLLALNVVNGEKIWEHNTEGKAAVRGLLINKKNKKIYFCDQKNLIALNSETGKLDTDFGNMGKIKLKNKCQTTPVIIGNKIIIATFEPGVEVYNLENGKISWKYYLMKKQNKYFRYGGKRYDYSGGNPWGGISIDKEREILFITTGNPGRFYEGVNRPGENRHTNSVVALDLKKKEILWEFQEIEHDIWNYDIASPPILTTITLKNQKIDVVVVATKFNNILVLDRLSGKHIFDYKKVKVPLSEIPGEKTSFYQKKFLLPKPLSRQEFKMEDVSNLLPGSKEFIEEKIKNFKYGFFEPNSTNHKILVYKGGAQWMGASVDNNTGTMFVNSSSVPSITWLEKIEKNNSYYRYDSKTEVLKDQYGYPGTKPPWGVLASINLNNGKTNWKVPFGEFKKLKKEGIPVTGSINYGGVTATDGGLVFATGTIDNKIRAFNSENGVELWNYEMKYLGSSPPSIFEFNNEQYIVVVSTGQYSVKSRFPEHTEFGDMVYAFKLK